MSDDPYFKLRPALPTPPDEMCQCQGDKPLKLVGSLTPNPLRCIDCNLEVDPQSLQLSAALVEVIATWGTVYAAIDHLWLDSGEYEAWAKQQLGDIESPINRRGLELLKMVAGVRSSYYWYFQDQSVDDFTPISHCPKCKQPFSLYRGGIFAQFMCKHCGIITVGNEI